MKEFIVAILILGSGGLIVMSVVSNDKVIPPKEYNKKYYDTPDYYKRYVATSVVYKSKHKL
jgi:hypothetical protein